MDSTNEKREKKLLKYSLCKRRCGPARHSSFKRAQISVLALSSTRCNYEMKILSKLFRARTEQKKRAQNLFQIMANGIGDKANCSGLQQMWFRDAIIMIIKWSCEYSSNTNPQKIGAQRECDMQPNHTHKLSRFSCRSCTRLSFVSARAVAKASDGPGALQRWKHVRDRTRIYNAIMPDADTTSHHTSVL